MRTRSTLLATSVVGLLLVAGCGSSSNDASSNGVSSTPPGHMTPSRHSGMPRTPATSTSGASMSGMAMITIKNFMYMGTMKVTPGELVMVTNEDAEAHTLTSDSAGSFAVTIAAHGMATFHAPMAPGSYSFHCAFHSNMHGSLVVG